MSMAKQTIFTTNRRTYRAFRQTPPRTYRRILVFLDGSRAAEQTLPKAIELANATGAGITIVTPRVEGHTDYLNQQCSLLEQQGIQTWVRTVSAEMKQLSAWVVNSEKADAVIIPRQNSGRHPRWSQKDSITKLRENTTAEVFTIAVHDD